MPQIISLTVHTGMRQGEVFGLKWDDVDLEKSCLFIRRSLSHVIDKGAVFIFTSPFGEPISPTNFSRRYFKPLLKKCDISSDFTFHSLRHNHAKLLLRQGVNPKIVQERLGHSSIKVTMDTYSHVLPDMQRQAVDALHK